MRSTDTTRTITALGLRVLPLLCAAFQPFGLAAPPSGDDSDAAALSVRAADLVAADLSRLGAAVWPRSVIPQLPPVLAVVAVPSGERLALEARLGAVTASAAGSVEELDRLACKLARAMAPRLGLRVPEGAELLLGGVDPAPSLVHLALGRAALDLASGQSARARMRYGRAEEIWGGVSLPESTEGAWAAQLRGAKDPSAQAAASAELARAALEKAEVGARAPDRGVPALASALRYWPDRALAWAMPVDARASVTAGQEVWWLGGRALEPRVGAALREARGKGRWVGELGEESLRLDGATLLRSTDLGATRWSRSLPWRDAQVAVDAVSGGFALAFGERGLAWIDASTGAIAQAEPAARVLAIGVDGALVELGGAVALLRPGRKAPAWTVPDPTPGTWALVAGRAIELGPSALRVLDSHDGKTRAEAIDAPEGARVLAAEGRYAVLGAGRTVAIVDVLGANELARFDGPSTAVAAASGEGGLLVAFESGDVFFVDREGTRADRARLLGRPSAVWPGRPGAPGFLVRTELGLFALGPVPTRERPRDLELAVELATRLLARGDALGARRWSERVALFGAGRAAEAEALRARTMDGDARPAVVRARAAALRRAEAARDPLTPLPPFALE